MPKISVIVPVYNGERYLRESIESVLSQSYRDFELIVVDDGSSDKTREVISQYEGKYSYFKAVYHSENKGVSAAKNSGIAVSTGEFLVFAAADDIQEQERLEVSIKALEENPDLDMVFIDCQMIDSEGNFLNRRKGYPAGMTSKNAIIYQLKRNHLWSGLVMLRNTPDIRFDETIPNAVDYELFLRMLLKGATLRIIGLPLLRYRVHENNISGNGKVSAKSVEKILHRLNFDEIFVDLSKTFVEDEVRVAIGGALLTSGKYERALEFLKDIELRPSLLMEGLFMQAISYYKLGRMQESLDIFKTAQRASPEDAAILNNIGVLSIVLNGEKEVACQLFEKALSLRPGYLDAASNTKCVEDHTFHSLRITERPLRENFIHVENYKI
jgi:glycosyltransferase involved in cell wall biosynthesis